MATSPIAALVALEPEFASLRPLVGYMLPVHVKKNAPDFGPGGGAHAKATLTSAVEALARRFNNRRSSIERDEGELPPSVVLRKELGVFAAARSERQRIAPAVK